MQRITLLYGFSWMDERMEQYPEDSVGITARRSCSILLTPVVLLARLDLSGARPIDFPEQCDDRQDAELMRRCVSSSAHSLQVDPLPNSIEVIELIGVPDGTGIVRFPQLAENRARLYAVCTVFETAQRL